ncbi:late cornified envelope protein 2C-like [Felis catus]|uniref:late cornified envelope protein 2C-like n=1 Tax=Felis catus TaxID=9685 RepID=UPI001D1A2866|nr:late cornified envelope protein 2C-like [Felis catus]
MSVPSVYLPSSCDVLREQPAAVPAPSQVPPAKISAQCSPLAPPTPPQLCSSPGGGCDPSSGAAAAWTTVGAMDAGETAPTPVTVVVGCSLGSHAGSGCGHGSGGGC